MAGWIGLAALAWLVLSVLVALLVGRTPGLADRIERRSADFLDAGRGDVENEAPHVLAVR